MLGRDMIVPPHAAWRWAAFGRPVARRERGVACGVLSWCANTRAHTRREMGEEGEPRGADRGGLGGVCGWWRVGW